MPGAELLERDDADDRGAERARAASGRGTGAGTRASPAPWLASASLFGPYCARRCSTSAGSSPDRRSTPRRVLTPPPPSGRATPVAARWPAGSLRSRVAIRSPPTHLQLDAASRVTIVPASPRRSAGVSSIDPIAASPPVSCDERACGAHLRPHRARPRTRSPPAPPASRGGSRAGPACPSRCRRRRRRSRSRARRASRSVASSALARSLSITASTPTSCFPAGPLRRCT